MSIIGDPFVDYVDKQIKVRQAALGEGLLGTQSSDLIKLKTQEAFNTSTPFIRLASAVRVNSPESTPFDPATDILTPESITLDPNVDDSTTEDEISTYDPLVQDYVREDLRYIAQADATYVDPAYAGQIPITINPGPEFPPQKPVPGKTVYEQIKSAGLFEDIPESEWVGDKLAHQCVLMGAPTPTQNNEGAITNSQISGVLGPTRGTFNAAYGWGYSKNGLSKGRGYVPPPGITSVDFEYKNDGALAQATVNIKCFSPDQFAILDILYMRPGYTCLLEFGHTTYLDNSGKLTTLDTLSTKPFEYLLNNQSGQANANPTYTEMSKLISSEKEKKEGNYEGFFGRITKFNWKFNQDGSYDITVKLTGTGDVIGSLNVVLPKLSKFPLSIAQPPNNSFSADKESIDSEAYLDGDFIISDAFESQLNFELFSIFKDSVKFPGNAEDVVPTSDASNWAASTWNFIAGGVNYFSSNENYAVSDLPIVGIPILGAKFNKLFPGGVIKSDVNDFGGVGYSPITFLPFGALLAMIQKICNVSDGKNNTLIQFEIVRNLFAAELKGTPQDFDGNSGQDFLEDDTYMSTFSGNISGDPNICIKKYSNFDTNVLGDGFAQMNPGGSVSYQQQAKDWTGRDSYTYLNAFIPPESLAVPDSSKIPQPSLAMRLSQVYINLNFVTKTLNELKEGDEDEEQQVPLLAFIQSLLSGINEACGGINNFRVIFNEDTSLIQIVSESPQLLAQLSSEQVFTKINTYGFDRSEDGKTNLGSFVTNIELDSELSDKMATQLSIGAASNNNVISANASSFASYSKGLEDALFVDKKAVISEETGEDIEKPIPQQVLEIMEEGEYVDTMIQVYGDREYQTGGYVDTLKALVSQISSKIQSVYYYEETAPAPFFLPFNTKITMQGLGGLKIFNAFKIDGKYLPLSYNPDEMKLIIKSLSHNVSLDGWKTTIQTLSTPDPQGNFTKLAPSPTPTGPPPNTSGGTSPSGTCAEKYKNEKYSITGLNNKFPALAKYKNYWNKPQSPVQGLNLQGKPISSFSRAMISSDGVPLPKPGWGVARRVFEALQVIGDEAKKEGLTGLNLNSHYRSPIYNCKVGGKPNSVHKTGAAVDIGAGGDPKKLRRIIERLIRQGKIPEGGVGLYNTFIHYDIRGYRARWDA